MAYPAIPLDLRAVSGLGPSGSFPHVRRPPPKHRNNGLRGLCLSYRALARALEPPLVGSSSRGIRVLPFRWHTSRASTPRSRGSLRTDVAKRRFAFRPRGFAPPRRFTPRESYGSVAPRNQPGVRRVSCLPPPRDVRRRCSSTGCSPRDAVHTLRRLPLASSRTTSLWPLPSCRYRPARRGSRPRSVSLPTAARRSEWRTSEFPTRGSPCFPAPRGGGPVAL